MVRIVAARERLPGTFVLPVACAALALLAMTAGCDRAPATSASGDGKSAPGASGDQAGVNAVEIAAALGGKGGQARGANLLLVTLDTTRADRLGCYGYKRVFTPAIDRLAREGVLFENAIAVAPTTLPAHASILTGLYPVHHGARVNGFFKLANEPLTLAEALRDAGFRTSAVVSSFVLHRRFGTDQGFEDYQDDFGGGSSGGGDYPERAGDRTTTLALSALHKMARERFFLWVHYYDAHHEYRPPPSFLNQHPDDPYLGEIEFVDSQLMRLLLELDAMGLSERTLVLVIGDHGESLMEHNEPTHGLLVYQPVLHIPMVMRLGKQLGPGLRVSTRVSEVDLMPTVLSLLGVEARAATDGSDLTQPVDAGRKLYFENLNATFSYAAAALGGVFDGNVKYIHAVEGELYDLAADPREARDLAPSDPSRAGSFYQFLPELFGPQLAKLTQAPATVQPSGEDLARLAALGYAGSSDAGEHEALGDPRAVAAALRELEDLRRLPADDAHYRLKALLIENPGFANGWRYLGELCLKSGQPAQAADALERSLKLGFVQSTAFLLADALAKEGKLDRCAEVLAQVASHVPDLLQTSVMADLLRLADGRETAVEVLRETLSLNADLVACLGDYFAGRGSLLSAEPVLRAHLADFPSSANVRLALAKQLVAAARLSDAASAFKDGVPGCLSNADFVNNYAMFLATSPDPALRDMPQAISLTEQYLRDQSDPDPSIHLTLSSLYATVNRLPEALSLAEEGRELAAARQNERLSASLERHIHRLREALGVGGAPTSSP